MTAEAPAPGQWRRLRSALGQDGELGIPSVEMPFALPAGSPRLAVGPVGEALLLIPLSRDEDFREMPSSRALGLRETVLSMRGEAGRFLELSCREARLEGVFEQLVEEILRRLSAGEPTNRAVTGTVDEFRALLDRPAGTMSMEALIGLLGELIVLNELLTIAPGAWRSWTGPSAGRHDFRAGAAAIECKTSRRTAGGQVTISAIDQLETPPDGELLLRVLVLEPDSAGSLSLEGLAQIAISAASDPSGLRALLATAGWSPVSSDWTTMRFSLLHDVSYRVGEGFPRLVRDSFREGDLPPGVLSVTYAVQLDLAAGFRLDPDELAAILGTIANAA